MAFNKLSDNKIFSGQVPSDTRWRDNFVSVTKDGISGIFLLLVGHGNRFVTTEPKFVYLKSPGVKFMNYFTDLKNPLLKSFGSYKVEWVKW